MADTYSTSAGDLEAGLAQRIGCDRVIAEPFDHGGVIGVLAQWGGVGYAVCVPTSGRRPHHSNPDWVASYPLPEDYQRAVEGLRDQRRASRVGGAS